MARRRTKIFVCTLGALSIAIVVNALFLQDGKHPAPIAATQVHEVPARTSVALEDGYTARMTLAQFPKTFDQLPAGKQRAVIAEIQKALAGMGLYTGKIDGIHGPKTRRAITAYQRVAGLKVTGDPTEELLGQIRYARLLKTVERTAEKAAPVPEPKPASLSRRTLARRMERPRPDPGPAPAASGDATHAPDVAAGDNGPARADRAGMTRLIAALDPEDRVDEVGSTQPVRRTPLSPVHEQAPPDAEQRAAPEKDAVAPESPRQTSAREPMPGNEPEEEPRKAVELIQSGLAELGYSPGPVDGLLSNETRRAIREFERDRGLQVTGNVSIGLIKELRKVTGISVLSNG